MLNAQFIYNSPVQSLHSTARWSLLVLCKQVDAKTCFPYTGQKPNLLQSFKGIQCTLHCKDAQLSPQYQGRLPFPLLSELRAASWEAKYDPENKSNTPNKMGLCKYRPLKPSSALIWKRYECGSAALAVTIHIQSGLALVNGPRL